MKIVTAIQADKVTKSVPLGTYANIVLRPQPRTGSKDSPIVLRTGEQARIKLMNGNDVKKWNWIAGKEHTRYIYIVANGVIKITSISGFYSGGIDNKFKVLEQKGNWYKVQTLKAGAAWWLLPIPSYCLHHVYALSKGGKLINSPCGDVVLPLITRTGWAWIEKWQAK